MYEDNIAIHFKKQEDENETKTSIEYFFINLPESMKSNNNLIDALVESGNHDYFESLPI